MDEQAILKKFEQLENLITNHVITEIANNREQIVGIYQTIIRMYDSQQRTTENVGVIADRLNQIQQQLRRVKLID